MSHNEKYIILRLIKEIKYTVYVVSRPTRGARPMTMKL